MEKKLYVLNSYSPFLWEVTREDGTYTILCEGLECYDSNTDIYLTSLSESDCMQWLSKLVAMIWEM